MSKAFKERFTQKGQFSHCVLTPMERPVLFFCFTAAKQFCNEYLGTFKVQLSVIHLARTPRSHIKLQGFMLKLSVVEYFIF